MRCCGGEGGVSATAISRTEGHRETVEAALERSHQKASRALIKFSKKVTGQVKVRSKVKNAGFHSGGF